MCIGQLRSEESGGEENRFPPLYYESVALLRLGTEPRRLLCLLFSTGLFVRSFVLMLTRDNGSELKVCKSYDEDHLSLRGERVASVF